MAKPIAAILPFTGEAAEWLAELIENSEPDPAKIALAAEDKKVVAQFVPLAVLKAQAKRDASSSRIQRAH